MIPSGTYHGAPEQPEYARFLSVAEASLAETEYLLILSQDLGYLDAEQVKPLADQVAEIARDGTPWVLSINGR